MRPPLLLLSATLAALSAAEPTVLRDARSVTVRHASGVVQVAVDAERRFHVRAAPGDTLPTTGSYVATAPAEAVPVTITETTGAVLVATAALTARIDLGTGAVTFLDPDGQVVLAEAARRFGPSPAPSVAGTGLLEVEQTFLTQADEALYGLGQQQDGHWDWAGLPVDLTQHNTVIAFPVLVSSKGYGVLWDNAARTVVNPPAQEVALTLASAPAPAGGPTATEQLAQAAKPAAGPEVRTGTFTAGAAGEYVFLVTEGDRRNLLALSVDGREIATQRNMWVPSTLAASTTLAAGQTVAVTLHGGGANVRLQAGPRDRRRTVLRSAVGPAVDYRVFYGPDLNRVVAEYRRATGPAPLWPRWAYGFWQCRERYESQQQWLDVVERMRREQWPVDLLVQDWQYWGKYGWGAYQWDEARYPDPRTAIAALHRQHVRLMVSVWPNPSGHAKEVLNRIPASSVGSYYDAYSPVVRAARWSVLKDTMFDLGVDAWWQDAAEPGDGGTDVEGRLTAAGPGSQHRLAYPLFHSQCVYEGQRATSEAKRVVNFTRSAYPGMQRYGAGAWSGDIKGDWVTLRRQLPAGLNLAIAGLPLWTSDCGGFFRPGDQHTNPDFNDLQRRWFQVSAFSPIHRIHGYQTRTEPWEWLPATQAVMRTYTNLRYRFLPYHYSTAAATTFAGATPMRPLVMDFPADVRARTIADQFLCGPSLLVSPVLTPAAAERRLWLPAGTPWVDFWTGERHAGGQEITVPAPEDRLPLHVRAGAIVPLGPEVPHAEAQTGATLELRVYPGADGSFTLYDDAGDGYGYERGERATIDLQWQDATRTLVLGARQGSYPGMPATRTFRVVVVGPGTGVGAGEAAGTTITYDGQARSHTLPR